MAKIPLSAMLRSYESSRMVTPTKPIHVSGTKIREECLNLPRGTPHRGKPSFEREREQGTPGLARAENSGSARSPAECGYGHPCLALACVCSSHFPYFASTSNLDSLPRRLCSSALSACSPGRPTPPLPVWLSVELYGQLAPLLLACPCSRSRDWGRECDEHVRGV